MTPTVLLTRHHKRGLFDCGNESLTRYLKEQATQDIKRNLALCFVTVDDDNRITGYYTLSNASIPKEHLPEAWGRKMGYAAIPVTLLGRLARDKTMQRTGHGEFLLMDALYRSYHAAASTSGSVAVITDPIDDAAEAFYTRYGFIKLAGSNRMFISMGTIAELLAIPA